MSNIQTVREIYEAFSRGDIDAILSRCADDIEWEYGATPTNVPWLQSRAGKSGAAAGMRASAEGVEIHKFVPNNILEAGDVVVALLDIDFTVKETGKRVVEDDGVHIWRFDADGKVCRFRHRVDTHQQHLACSP